MVLRPVDVNAMNFFDWIELGVERGWCSQEVCFTHDGAPMSDEEEAAWEEGLDPCLFAVRIYGP